MALESMQENRKRSWQIIEKEVGQAVGPEEKRLIFWCGSIFWRLWSGELILFSKPSGDDNISQHWYGR